LFSARTGEVDPDATGNQVTVADFDTPIAIMAEFKNKQDSLAVLHRSLDDSRWLPVTDGLGAVFLHSGNSSCILDTPDTYTVSGNMEGETNFGYIED
jgi:hypothetical protein